MGPHNSLLEGDPTMFEMIRSERRPRLVVLPAIALVALVSACGGGSSKSAASASTATTQGSSAPPASTTVAPATNPDPCTLVTKAEAEKLAETPLQPAVKSGSGDDQMCQYTGAPTGPTAQVEIFSGLGVKKNLDIDRTLKHTFTTLSGIGDEAYLEDNNVFVRKGTVWVGINTVLLDVSPDKVQAGLQELARTMVARVS